MKPDKELTPQEWSIKLQELHAEYRQKRFAAPDFIAIVRRIQAATLLQAAERARACYADPNWNSSYRAAAEFIALTLEKKPNIK